MASPVLVEAYRRLGVRCGATLREVEKAYRRCARETHPDRRAGGDASADAASGGGGSGSGDNGAAAFLCVKEAYELVAGSLRGGDGVSGAAAATRTSSAAAAAATPPLSSSRRHTRVPVSVSQERSAVFEAAAHGGLWDSIFMERRGVISRRKVRRTGGGGGGADGSILASACSTSHLAPVTGGSVAGSHRFGIRPSSGVVSGGGGCGPSGRRELEVPASHLFSRGSAAAAAAAVGVPQRSSSSLSGRGGCLGGNSGGSGSGGARCTLPPRPDTATGGGGGGGRGGGGGGGGGRRLADMSFQAGQVRPARRRLGSAGRGGDDGTLQRRRRHSLHGLHCLPSAFAETPEPACGGEPLFSFLAGRVPL